MLALNESLKLFLPVGNRLKYNGLNLPKYQ